MRATTSRDFKLIPTRAPAEGTANATSMREPEPGSVVGSVVSFLVCAVFPITGAYVGVLWVRSLFNYGDEWFIVAFFARIQEFAQLKGPIGLFAGIIFPVGMIGFTTLIGCWLLKLVVAF